MFWGIFSILGVFIFRCFFNFGCFGSGCLGLGVLNFLVFLILGVFFFNFGCFKYWVFFSILGVLGLGVCVWVFWGVFGCFFNFGCFQFWVFF